MDEHGSTAPRQCGWLSVAGLILASLLAAGPAQAQALVNDPPHTIKTVLGWINTHKQDLKQIQQWRDQLNHYQQQLVSASKLLDRSMTMTMDFEERALDYGMADQCRAPGSGGGGGSVLSLAALWARVAPDLNGDIKAQQYDICQRMVMTGNARFNEQVRMINNIQERDRELKAIAARAQSIGSSQGMLESVKAELSQFGARATMDMQYSESVLVAYDGMLVSLGQDQQRLAQRALHGVGQDSISAVVQGASLKGALKLARRRDR